jgi:FkbM family methyltransferase
MMVCVHSISLGGRNKQVVVSRFLRKYSYYLLSIAKLLFGFYDPILITKIFLNLANPGIKTVRLRRLSLQFRVRGAMDVWSIKETFLDRFYEKFGFTIQPNWKIIDIGAGVGDYSLYAAVTQPNSKIFSFEPFPESFALMQENLRLNTIKNVQVFEQAVGASSGELILDLAGGEPLQFQSYLGSTVNVNQSLSVSSVSLADVLARFEIESCDLLKLDCEGAEYPILFGTQETCLARIKRIVMEYHDNLTQYSHKDLTHFLNEHGFQVESFSNPVHPHLGYLRAIRKM